MTFKSEADFEEALIRVLQQNAWEKEVITGQIFFMITTEVLTD